MIRFENEKPGRRGLSVPANLETYREGFLSVGEHDLYLVPRTERTGESNVSNSGQDALPRLLRTRAERQSKMRHARQDRCALEMAVEAAALRGDPEPPGAGSRSGWCGDRNEAGSGEESQREGV